MSKLSHFDRDGKAAMVDVSGKSDTHRTAIAKGRIQMKAETLRLIADGSAAKGDVLGAARIAGIMAAKKTSDLIPLCHPLAISKVSVDFEINGKDNAVEITAEVKVSGKTGVEMEALTAVSVAGLTIYDMVKAVDKSMVIGDIQVTYKEGGKSGTLGSKELDRPASVPVKKQGRTRATAKPSQVPMTQARTIGLSDKREALRNFIDAKRIKPMVWAKDAGVPSGVLYSFLQGKSSSLSSEDEAKLAAAVNMSPEDLYPGIAG
jgi:cyclic pyranopterin phosphate synthase